MSSDVERLIQEILTLPPEDRRRVQAALGDNATGEGSPATPTQPMSDAEYQQRLVEAGLLKDVKPRRRDHDAFERFQPVEISGQPLSETIIEERR